MVSTIGRILPDTLRNRPTRTPGILMATAVTGPQLIS